jgi:NTE family protein
MPAPRVALVLGGGGLTGTAFHAGVLAGLADATGWDPRDAALIVGTSAGSTSAALLRAGLPPADLVARMTGAPLSEEGARVLGDLGPLHRPPKVGRTAARPAAPHLVGSLARHPSRFRPGVAAAALLPEGTRSVAESVSGISDLFPTWPERPTWICTVRLDDGHRVVFGRDAQATMREAISASCAIPGYYAPVLIDGRRHVDGGTWSAHNLDLVAGQDVALVVVSAPMSVADPRPTDWASWLRIPVRHRLDRERAMVRRSGLEVVALQPDRALCEVMGAQTMRLSRRGPVAEATRAHVATLVADGPIGRLLRRGGPTAGGTPGR